MKNLKGFDQMNESEYKQVVNGKMVEVPGLFQVVHEQYATDRYSYGMTVVKASSEQDAFDKLNAYLETKPDGHYTAKPCPNVSYVSPLKVYDAEWISLNKK